MHACTVTTRSHLARARVLARSFLEHHPGSTIHGLVIDPGPGLQAGQEPFEILVPQDLFGPDDWGPMWFAYTAAELAYASKPFLIRYVLDRYGERALYLDSDMRCYGSLDRLDELLRGQAVVLTPHIVHPLSPEQKFPTELTFLRFGVYNAGFLSVGQEGRDFINWWWQHLRRQSLSAPDQGLVGDQRWLDLAPIFFDCHVLKDPTVNVAYWNLAGRQLDYVGDRFLIDGEPLTLFHFSGYDPHRPWFLARFKVVETGLWPSERPALRRLCDQYAAELLGAGHDEVSRLVMDQVTLSNGTVLDQRARRVFRNAVTPTDPSATVPEVPNPLSNPAGLVAWLREPCDPAHPTWLSRYLYQLYRERRGLARAFPDVPGEDAPRFLAWVRRRGALKAGIPEALMPPQAAGAPTGPLPQAVGPGVNVIGYLRAESGLGEAARQIVGAAEALGVPLATHTLSLTDLRARPEHDFADRQPVPGLINPYDMSILCMNGPEVHRLASAMGPGFLSGRCAVGAWVWGFAEIPASWSAGLDAVDEVWLSNELAATYARKVISKPVRVFPLPVQLPVPSAADRSTLGLPDGFLFLFVFSYSSGFERKNPVGLVRAFARAFSPGEGPRLLIKAVRDDEFRKEREHLRYEIGDRPDIVLLEDYLAAGDKNGLMASCDCYVSLHRAEGFGLTMAEAMALGKPTIATGYSGNLEFMTPDNSFLIGYVEGRVPPGSGQCPVGAVWAEPDLAEAAVMMRRVYEHPEEARRVGDRARADMARLHGPEARARLLAQLLDQARAAWEKRQPAAGPLAPVVPGGDIPVASAQAPASVGAGPAVAGSPQHEDLSRAERDLIWLLRRLETPPLGWILSRRKGFRKLRNRWVGSV